MPEAGLLKKWWIVQPHAVSWIPVVSLLWLIWFLHQSMLFKPTLNAVDGPLQPNRHILYAASCIEHLHKQFILLRIPGKTSALLPGCWYRTPNDTLAIRQTQKYRPVPDYTRAAKKLCGHLFIGCAAAVSMAQISVLLGRPRFAVIDPVGS